MTSGNFDACIPFIFREEGGFTRDPHDAGNWTGGKIGQGVLKGTNFGIAASSHPTLDIANLTKAEAAKLYRVEYWNACNCDLLASGVDLVVMDVAVNSGVGRGRSYRDATAPIRDAQKRVDVMSDKRRAFYKGLKTFSRYGKVWLGRVARIQAAATKMVLAGAETAAAAIKAELLARAVQADAGAAKAKQQAAVAGAGSGSAATASVSTMPAPDQAAHPTVFLMLLAVVVGGGIVVALLIHRARAHRELASAYADVAAETN
jgi:lysozyme family protein